MARGHAPALPKTALAFVETVHRQAKGMVRLCNRWSAWNATSPHTNTARQIGQEASVLVGRCEEWLKKETGSIAPSHHEREAS